MSARANVHFCHKGGAIASNVYVHNGGCPDRFEFSLHKFLDETAKLADRRWDDPEYLAAKFIVWRALEYQRIVATFGGKKCKALDFLGVGPCVEDRPDISYVYKVVCDGNRPLVYVAEAGSALFRLIERTGTGGIELKDQPSVSS